MSEDRSTFVRIASAVDPLTADVLTAALGEAGIAFRVEEHASPVDVLTAPGGPSWEIFTLPAAAERALSVIAEARRNLEENAEDAARAAEEEALPT